MFKSKLFLNLLQLYNKNKKLNIKPLCIPLYKKQKKKQQKKINRSRHRRKSPHSRKHRSRYLFSNYFINFFFTFNTYSRYLFNKVICFCLDSDCFFLFNTDIFFLNCFYCYILIFVYYLFNLISRSRKSSRTRSR